MIVKSGGRRVGGEYARRRAARMLRDRGYRVVEAENSEPLIAGFDPMDEADGVEGTLAYRLLAPTIGFRH